MEVVNSEDRAGVWKEFEQNPITHSAAHHLMAIGDLTQRLGYARVSDVAKQLKITRGSVSISLRGLKKDGLFDRAAGMVTWSSPISPAARSNRSSEPMRSFHN